MSQTLIQPLDANTAEIWLQALRTCSYEQLRTLRLTLATGALADDDLARQLLPLAVSEADTRPEAKAAQSRQWHWRIDYWLAPVRRCSFGYWKVRELNDGDDIATAEPCASADLPPSHPAVAYVDFMRRVPKAAAAHHRLVLQGAAK